MSYSSQEVSFEWLLTISFPFIYNVYFHFTIVQNSRVKLYLRLDL